MLQGCPPRVISVGRRPAPVAGHVRFRRKPDVSAPVHSTDFATSLNRRAGPQARRKRCLTDMAERGLTPHEIMSISGLTDL